MIVNFFFEILITRLKNMVHCLHTKIYRVGLLGLILVVLFLCACGDSETSRKRYCRECPR